MFRAMNQYFILLNQLFVNVLKWENQSDNTLFVIKTTSCMTQHHKNKKTLTSNIFNLKIPSIEAQK